MNDARVGRRKLTNLIMVGLLGFAAVVAILPLFAVLAYVVARGAGSINLAFFTQLPPAPGAAGGGMGNAILGTLELILIASTLAIPVGVLAGVYLAEYGDESRLGGVVRFCSDVLTGVPTIVTGLFVFGLLVLTMGHFSALAGGIALGLIMIPILTRTTEEVVRLVPNAIREAALALGARRWTTIVRVVLPAASSGIVTGIMLSVSRVAGETAPLLYTAANYSYWSVNPDKPISSLSVMIFNFATGPYANWHRQAWAAALVLICIVLVFNLGARWLTRSRSIAERG